MGSCWRAFYGIDCVRECAENMYVIMENQLFKTLALLDQPPPSFPDTSSIFPLHDKDFHIDLPRENWKVNEYS